MPDTLPEAAEHSSEAYLVAKSARRMRQVASDLATLNDSEIGPQAIRLAVKIRRVADEVDELRRKFMARPKQRAWD
jgi:hypothetical protein